MAVLAEPIKGVPLVKNFIDGEWVESKGPVVDVVNPANNEVIAKVGVSAKDEIDSAVAAAKAAFPDWRRTPPLARSRILFRLKALDMGKKIIQFYIDAAGQSKCLMADIPRVMERIAKGRAGRLTILEELARKV